MSQVLKEHLFLLRGYETKRVEVSFCRCFCGQARTTTIHPHRQQVAREIAERNEARKNKDYAKSDAIRDELLAQKIELMDSREGTSWKKI